MNAEARALLKQVISLSPVERAEMIEAIFKSFDNSPDNNINAAWADEAESRIDAYEAGKIKASSVNAVMRRIGKK